MRSFASFLAAALALSPAAFGHKHAHSTVENHHHKHTTTSHKPAKTHTEHSTSKTTHKVTATPANQFAVSRKSRLPFRSRTKTSAPTTTQAKLTTTEAKPTTTQAKPTTTQAAPPAATTSAAPAGDSVEAISLQKHNELRAQHHAPALTWNTDLADAAQAWANKCVFQHGGGKSLSSGENIAAYSGSKADVAYAISLWSDEEAQYDYNKPGYADSTGHFTQMASPSLRSKVWKGTTQLGCAQAYCDPLTFPGSSSWSGYFYVCEYLAAGNIVGSDSATTAKYFSANVEAP